MDMDFNIPDITENADKAAGGGKHRKPRRAGKIRLGDTIRSISKCYTATEEKKNEDRGITFYSLSEGEETFSFYGMDVSMIGVCIRHKKTAAIYMELPAKDRDTFIKSLEKSEGKGQDAAGMTIFADTVTSIFVTKPEKSDSVITIALMDSEEAKALSDNEAIAEEEEEKSKGLGHKIFKVYFNPIGRMSRKSYIPKMLGGWYSGGCSLCFYLHQTGVVRRRSESLYFHVPCSRDSLLYFAHQSRHPPSFGHWPFPSVLLAVFPDSLCH